VRLSGVRLTLFFDQAAEWLQMPEVQLGIKRLLSLLREFTTSVEKDRNLISVSAGLVGGGKNSSLFRLCSSLVPPFFLSTGQKIISALAKMAKSLIWRKLRDYASKVLLCKAFKDFVLYLAFFQHFSSRLRYVVTRIASE
jgi:hypothetical protein